MQTASELYARSQSRQCEGPWRCHWCGGPCGNSVIHDDLPELVGVKRNQKLARCPANPWMCVGCQLWRRGRLTITWLHGAGSLDGQTPREHGWLITDEWANAVHPAGGTELVKLLLNPPDRFALLLLTEPRLNNEPRRPGAIQNQIHLAHLNEHTDLKADTPLAFTLDNVTFTYTVYDLEQAFITGTDGKEPGVRALFELFGLTIKESEEEKRKKGRPEALPTAKITSAKTVKKV